ncbi:uncharacterized protein [Clytia hemisphaerica]|uniref:Uncharacterized protein n=1 Tax=Clytia hemisphaerica TaxID=252671 RepID=A0A7M5V3R2_9CNID
MIEPPPPYEVFENEKAEEDDHSNRQSSQPTPFILLKNKDFFVRSTSIFIVVNTTFLTINWVMIVILRWKLGDSDGSLSAFSSESSMYMAGNLILWISNILFILANVTEISNRLKGGDINIHKIMIGICVICSFLVLVGCLWGIASMTRPFFQFRSDSEMDEYRGLWTCMIIGLVTSVLSAMQAFLHYRLDDNEMIGLVGVFPCFVVFVPLWERCKVDFEKKKMRNEERINDL